jgi:threonine synthase
MNGFTGYRCSLCGEEYRPEQVDYTCPKDSGNLDVVLDYQHVLRNHSPKSISASRERSMWRYLPLLPISDPGGLNTPLRVVGGTPIFALPELAQSLGLHQLWVKDESRNPTASFKDRASALVVARARQVGAKAVVTASTGNAGAALAGMAAAVGQEAIIFAPRSAPPAKIAQLLVFGARVILVDGSYDQAFDLSIQAANEFGWYIRNTGYNPFTAEGKKTAAFEIWEWLADQSGVRVDAPLNIFVSVGDGNIISGIHKGFKDLIELGWLERMPRLFGVQAEGSAAIANAGLVNAVDQGLISLDDPVLVLNTGSGQKDVKAALQAVPQAPVIEPTIQAVRKMIELNH